MIFPVVDCPEWVSAIAKEFETETKEHSAAFCAVLCAYLFGVSNFSDIMRYFLFSPSVSSLDRLFNDEKIFKNLNRKHRRRILKILKQLESNPSRYIWAIDDTLISHWGKNIWGTYNWKDHNTNGYIWGHKLLVLGLIDTKRKILIPVFWELLHREGQEDKGAKHQKGWKVALRLLKDAMNIGFPNLPVVLDSWFAGSDFFRSLEENNITYVMELKNNRIIQKHGKKQIGKSIADFFSNRFRNKIFYLGRMKWASSATLQLKDYDKQLKIAAVANKKGLAHECFAYYVSNQLTWDATKLWEMARNRWSIEVQFRELKQLFALGGAAVRSKQAVETSISISMIALTVIRFEQLSQVDANENQYARPCPASSIVQNFQLKSLKHGVTKLASIDEPLILDKFRKRLNKNNFGRKPTQKPREYIELTGS